MQRTSGRCYSRNVRWDQSSNCLRRDTHDFTAEYNAWLEAIPAISEELVFVVKRFYKPEWGDMARAFQRGRHQRHARERIEVRQPETGHELSAGRVRLGRRLAHVWVAQRFSSGGQIAAGG